MSPDAKGIKDIQANRKTNGLFRDRVAIIDRRTGTVERFLDGFGSVSVGELRFSRDGNHLAMTNKNEVLIREVATGKEVVRRAVPKSQGGQEWGGIFYQSDGSLLGLFSLLKDKKHAFALWDIRADKPAHSASPLDHAGIEMEMLLVSPEGNRCLIPAIPLFEILFAKEAKEKAVPPPSRLYELPGGKLLTGFAAEREDRDYVGTFRLSSGAKHSLSMVMSMDMAASGSAIKNSFWVVHEIPSGKSVLRIPNSTSEETACDFSPDGRFVAIGAARGHVELWDIASKQLVFRWQPHGGKMIRHLAFSPEGDLATSDDERLHLLKVTALRAELAKIGLDWQ